MVFPGVGVVSVQAGERSGLIAGQDERGAGVEGYGPEGITGSAVFEQLPSGQIDGLGAQVGEFEVLPAVAGVPGVVHHFGQIDRMPLALGEVHAVGVGGRFADPAQLIAGLRGVGVAEIVDEFRVPLGLLLIIGSAVSVAPGRLDIPVQIVAEFGVVGAAAGGYLRGVCGIDVGGVLLPFGGIGCTAGQVLGQEIGEQKLVDVVVFVQVGHGVHLPGTPHLSRDVAVVLLPQGTAVDPVALVVDQALGEQVVIGSGHVREAGIGMLGDERIVDRFQPAAGVIAHIHRLQEAAAAVVFLVDVFLDQLAHFVVGVGDQPYFLLVIYLLVYR